MADNADNTLFKEWEQARDVLKTFDERIHDLRKYGFSFVTGLMTIEGILLPWTPPTTTQGATGVPDEAKFGILAATALLIIVLRWFDGNYQGFLYGASFRAIVVERFLNLELTDQIAVRYKAERLWLPKIILYVGFEAAVIGLALALLPEKHWNWILFFSVGLFFESILYYLFASPQRLKGSAGGTDWALNRLECKKDEVIRIMVTNFNSAKKFSWNELRWKIQEITWPPDKTAWLIKDKFDNIVYRENVLAGRKGLPLPTRKEIIVQPSFSYVWAYKVKLAPGVYRIFVNVDKKQEERELSRKLYVT